MRAYLSGASVEELNTAREMLCWPGKLRQLAPAHVITRVITHVFHHQGQVLAMLRIMGRMCPAG